MNNRKTIFWAGNDPAHLKPGKDVLSEAYTVFTFNSGDGLLSILENDIPDLILLDVEMPEVSGYETMRRIRGKQEARHIPVIFLTSKNDCDSELYGLSLGAVDYIRKPFSPLLLYKRVELHLLVESQKQDLVSYNKNLQDLVDAKTKTVVELQNALLKAMAELVEFRDEITGGHIDRTQNYMRILLNGLREKGLYGDEIATWDIELVLQSAQLHDVGKIAVKDRILQKPDKLSVQEFEEIKAHTLFGETLIDRIKKSTTEQTFWEYAKIMAGTHHERWDGSGYPRGLQGTDIPLQGRLMAIADVYDSLVSIRPYKKAFTHAHAVKCILASKGSHFDPVLVDLFLSVSGQFKEISKIYGSGIGKPAVIEEHAE